MITTVTLNPCIDRTIVIDGFIYGGYNKALRTREDASGKGINVSVALKQLGIDSTAVWFKHKNDGVRLAEKLSEHKIPNEFVEVEGSMRVNIKLFNQNEGIMTEINEAGASVGAQKVEQILGKIVNQTKDMTQSDSILILTGSVPKGVPDDFYAKTMVSVSSSGSNTKVILDADHELFWEGIQAKPYLVKPNIFELENFTKRKLRTHKEIIDGARELLQKGIKIVVVSMGKDGAMIVNSEEVYFSEGTNIQVKGIQGAGDSMVAGICLAMRENLPLDEMLRYAVAGAHASLIREGTLLCTKDDFLFMLKKIQVEKL